MAQSAATCFHCGAEILPGQLVTGDRDGEPFTFCCRGCLGAWLLITSAGLGEFYRRREWREQGIGTDAFHGDYHDSSICRYVYENGDQSAIDIIIEGIRCAACVWLNEKIIGHIPGVTDVRVNYATSRARVIFEPGVVSPSAIFKRIAEIGYIPRPYTRSAADERAERERTDLLVRFGTAFFLTMQLMAFSFALYAGYFQGIAPEMKQLMQLFSFLVTTPVIFYAGWPFLRGGWRGVVNRAPNMDLLIAVGALSSYGYSMYATLTGGEVYYETGQAHVTGLDWAPVLRVALDNARKAGVQDRYNMLPGSAFEIDFGGPYDIVLLTNFLHHFDQPTCIALLKKIKVALRPGGRVATLEFVPNEDRVSPPMPAAFSMTMLTTTAAGDAYTFSELAAMYHHAGLGGVTAHPIPMSPHTIVMGCGEV